MDWYLYAGVIVIGFVAGFLNTMAGGGSLLTLPFLIWLGLPPNVANGTNRISILFQNISATYSYSKSGIVDLFKQKDIYLFAVLGSILGANIGVKIDNELFEKIIGIVLIIMLFVVIFQPEVWIKKNASDAKPLARWLQYIIFFGIGIYGGLIQAGIGFILLAGLVMGAGLDLLRANILKIVIVLLYTIFALGIYLWNDQVDIKLGLLLSLGSAVGAYIASKWSLKKGAGMIRYFLMGALIISAIKLIWF